MNIDSKYNLDFQAAKFSQQILTDIMNPASEIKPLEVENLVTKTLGVLQENGVYACVLYLQSRKDKDTKISSSVLKNLFDMTTLIGIKPPIDSSSTGKLDFVSNNIYNNLDTLFLIKQLWEQTLIYARYGAKAAKDGGL